MLRVPCAFDGVIISIGKMTNIDVASSNEFSGRVDLAIGYFISSVACVILSTGCDILR